MPLQYRAKDTLYSTATARVMWVICDAVIFTFLLTSLVRDIEANSCGLISLPPSNLHYRNENTNRRILIYYKGKAFEELIILRTTLSYAPFHKAVKPYTERM